LDITQRALGLPIDRPNWILWKWSASRRWEGKRLPNRKDLSAGYPVGVFIKRDASRKNPRLVWGYRPGRTSGASGWLASGVCQDAGWLPCEPNL